MEAVGQPAAADPPALWDPVVRISHWGIALVVLLNAAITEDGGLAHVWIGWAGIALLALRLVWGVVGPVEARFSAFPPDPRAAFVHVRALFRGERPRHRSHNPAGAVMVYAIWTVLAVILTTGVAMTGTGPLGVADRSAAIETQDWSTLDLGESREEGRDGRRGEALEEVHEAAANLILLLVLIHVAGVAAESFLMRRNLVRAMLTGGDAPGGAAR